VLIPATSTVNSEELSKSNNLSTLLVEIKSTVIETSCVSGVLAAAAPIPALGNPVPPVPYEPSPC